MFTFQNSGCSIFCCRQILSNIDVAMDSPVYDVETVFHLGQPLIASGNVFSNMCDG